MTQSNLTFTESHEIPEGYKLTDLGQCPLIWEVKPLKDVAKVIDSLHMTPSFSNDGYPMVRVADIKTGNLDLSSTLKVNRHVFLNFIRNYKPQKNDIVLSRVGSYGVSSFVATEEEFCIGQNTVVIKSNINANYLYYALNAKTTWQQIENGSFGSGYKSLSLKNINELKIYVPDILEQQKIAKALSDTDALISELEKLIEKKQAIKTATMQQLLTGKTRLPEFALREDGTPKGYKDSELGQIPDDWYVRKLGELVEITSGESPSKFNFVNDGIPYFKVEQLNNGNFYAESTPYSVKLGKTILAGSLIFPKRGASILSNKIRILKVNACMDTNLMALTCSHELNPNYLLYSLSYGGLDKVADTTSIPQINNKHILPYKIFYPFIGEQIRISSILVDLENDIELSQQKVEKLRKIKLGMMQELLTGKTRLV